MRGEATRPDALRRGDNSGRNSAVDISPGGVSVLIFALGLLYGLCMGAFALFKASGPNGWQILASALKVPLLFFLTLLVTFPSLYVFNALVGSRLSLGSVLRLLIAGLAVMAALLASFGPIVAFFSASATSYAFMKILNVIVFSVAGILGLRYLLTTLHRLTVASGEGTPTPPSASYELDLPAATDPAGRLVTPPLPVRRPPGALDTKGETMGRDVTNVFRIWVVVFGLVGAQMAWVLRPFIGNPNQAFTMFRGRESNIFEAILSALASLFSGG